MTTQFVAFASFFGILAVDFGENVLDLGIGVGIDEMAKEISEAEEVAKATNCVVFL